MRALVIGGGIGGLTSAIALRQHGIEAVVFERAPELRQVQVGFGVHLWHNGMRALQKLDLADRVQAVGGPGAVLQRAEFCDHRGKVLAAWSVSDVQREIGAPTVGISRGELHTVLAEALGPDALRLGTTCTGFVEEDGQVVARFVDGHEERGDVLIGADGIGSVIRGQILGESSPRFAGYATWQAFVDFVDERAPIGLFRVLWGPAARFLFYRVSRDRIYWMVQVASKEAEPAGSDKKRTLLQRLAHWAPPVEDMIEATPETSITRMDVYDRPPSKRWGVGRVTLLGDAAHPMTNNAGQGANQAIEDAVVLARCLAEGTSPDAALRAYEQARMPRTAKFTRLSRFLGVLSQWKNPAACAARGRMIAFSFSPKGLKRQIADWGYEA